MTPIGEKFQITSWEPEESSETDILSRWVFFMGHSKLPGISEQLLDRVEYIILNKDQRQCEFKSEVRPYKDAPKKRWQAFICQPFKDQYLEERLDQDKRIKGLLDTGGPANNLRLEEEIIEFAKWLGKKIDSLSDILESIHEDLSSMKLSP